MDDILTSEDRVVALKLIEGKALTAEEDYIKRSGEGLSNRLRSYLNNRTSAVEIAVALTTHSQFMLLVPKMIEVLEKFASVEERREAREAAREAGLDQTFYGKNGLIAGTVGALLLLLSNSITLYFAS